MEDLQISGDQGGRRSATTAELVRGRRASRNVNELHRELSSAGDRLADRLAELGGSWTFIVGFLAILALWVGVNTLQLLVKPFDPYPFIFLNLVLSCLAALQAPVILMSQNRQSIHDRLSAEHDYEVNLKAEMQVEELHRKLDELRDEKWADLVSLQQRQLELLERIIETLEGRQSSSEPARPRARVGINGRKRVSPGSGEMPGVIDEEGSSGTMGVMVVIVDETVTYGVYCPWPRVEQLCWSRRERQCDYLKSFESPPDLTFLEPCPSGSSNVNVGPTAAKAHSNRTHVRFLSLA